ncbi:MAG: putative colanic acid biosynthesis acetyltransferase [Colwellia sp.]|nr:putative colanic acid biosynthesis acetyltransferase [Colwellia sp.]
MKVNGTVMLFNKGVRNLEIRQKKNMGSSTFSWRNKLKRTIWAVVYYAFFRLTPTPLFGLRGFILKMFGSAVGPRVNVYPSVKIWLPENLSIEEGSALGPDVKVYNQGTITIGKNAIVSQGAHLCASTHNYNDPVHPLELAPINIGDNAWICADAFIGPGVTVAGGTVVGARAVVVKDTTEWSVYAGNPAKKVKERKRFE